MIHKINSPLVIVAKKYMPSSTYSTIINAMLHHLLDCRQWNTTSGASFRSISKHKCGPLLKGGEYKQYPATGFQLTLQIKQDLPICQESTFVYHVSADHGYTQSHTFLIKICCASRFQDAFVTFKNTAGWNNIHRHDMTA